MNKYELYIIGNDGKLHPTNLWERGYKLSTIEDKLNQKIKQINRACVIVIKPLKH